MIKLNRLLTWPILILIVLAGTALAAGDVPTPDADAAGWAKALYEALTSKEWGIASGLALTGIIYLARRFGPRWFKGEVGAMILGLLISLGTTIGVTLAAGAEFNWRLLLTAAASAAEAAALWQWIKDRLGVSSPSEAT